MQPQSIMEEQESRRELYDGLKRLTQREQTYLLYRYGFTDGKKPVSYTHLRRCSMN